MALVTCWKPPSSVRGRQRISQSAQLKQRDSNSGSGQISFSCTSVSSGVVVLMLRDGSPSAMLFLNQLHKNSRYSSFFSTIMIL